MKAYTPLLFLALLLTSCQDTLLPTVGEPATGDTDPLDGDIAVCISIDGGNITTRETTPMPRQLTSTDNYQHADVVRLYAFRSLTQTFDTDPVTGQRRETTAYRYAPCTDIDTVERPYLTVDKFKKTNGAIWDDETNGNHEQYIYSVKNKVLGGYYYRFLAIARDDVTDDDDTQSRFDISFPYGTSLKEATAKLHEQNITTTTTTTADTIAVHKEYAPLATGLVVPYDNTTTSTTTTSVVTINGEPQPSTYTYTHPADGTTTYGDATTTTTTASQPTVTTRTEVRNTVERPDGLTEDSQVPLTGAYYFEHEQDAKGNWHITNGGRSAYLAGATTSVRTTTTTTTTVQRTTTLTKYYTATELFAGFTTEPFYIPRRDESGDYKSYAQITLRRRVAGLLMNVTNVPYDMPYDSAPSQRGVVRSVAIVPDDDAEFASIIKLRGVDPGEDKTITFEHYAAPFELGYTRPLLSVDIPATFTRDQMMNVWKAPGVNDGDGDEKKGKDHLLLNKIGIKGVFVSPQPALKDCVSDVMGRTPLRLAYLDAQGHTIQSKPLRVRDEIPVDDDGKPLDPTGTPVVPTLNNYHLLPNHLYCLGQKSKTNDDPFNLAPTEPNGNTPVLKRGAWQSDVNIAL